MQKDRSTRTKGASIRPSSFKTERDWVKGMKDYTAVPLLGEKPAREDVVSARAFPYDRLRWIEVVADEVDTSITRHELASYLLGEGSRWILSLPSVDSIRDWRPTILKYGDADDAKTYREFHFGCSATERTVKHTFHVLKTDRQKVDAVCEKTRMLQDEVAAVAITWALSQIMRQCPTIAPKDVRQSWEADVERFVRELKGRASKSRRRGTEVSRGR